ncbi:MAG: phosphoribosylformylglycinamidine synthase subunit PurQ [Deltaproteobacteria bacterium]|jgi:phosphoribosylformylglycinamidine synthase|nr:phosphoribosylformylglycinamidine synthase subunit PurQ [Deltaproteobacteria bacterium]
MTAARPGGARYRTAVVVFPGSNCDMDCARSLEAATGRKPDMVWHKDTRMDDYDLTVLPGGFSYGDYLRTGAIARFSPVMAEVARLSRRGNAVIGICNGFQILTEAGLLPGALIRNRHLKYICKDVHIRVENAGTPFTANYRAGQALRIPVSHGEGCYYADPDTLRELQDRDRVVFRYSDAEGRVDPDGAPNGSLDAIAGIINGQGNVLGLMPHPERAAEEELGCTDGLAVWTSVVDTLDRAATI